MKEISQSGFSLLEVLVSVVILSVGLVAALTLLNSSISLNQDVNNRLVASMLVDQAIVHIQSIRDTNILIGDEWDAEFSDCVGSGVECILGFPKVCFSCGGIKFSCAGNAPELIEAAGETNVFYNRGDVDTLNYYQSKNNKACFRNDATIYDRTITIERISDDHIKPTVTVSWNDQEPHVISLTTDFYNVP